MKTGCCGVSGIFYGKSAVASDRNAEGDCQAADFETAIAAAGFGKFNLILLLISLPAAWTSAFETTTMSYVFPAAQCDLNLTLENKGVLNAVTFVGMISSGLIWGLFADTLGRKKLLVYGYLFDGISVLVSGFSQNFWMLLVTKFIGGSIINGPFAALTSYLSEFHSQQHRARIVLVRGLLVNLSNIVLPLLALLVLPRNINVSWFEGNISLRSWNIFLLLCALPSLLAFVGFLLLPESPKFLLAANRPEEALNVLKIVYNINTGKPVTSFPIKRLINNNDGAATHIKLTTKVSKSEAIKNGFNQVKPLFCSPYRSKIIIVCAIELGLHLSANTLRLWFPQIFTSISDYKLLHNDSSASLCEMLKMVDPVQSNSTETECFVNTLNHVAYINSLIVASTTLIGFIVATTLINYVGKRLFFSILTTGAGACAFSLYFAKNSEITLTLSSVFMAQAAVSVNVLFAVLVEMFPTTIRTMALSVSMLIGRIGSIFGNLMFPILLKIDCLVPFLFYGIILAGCSCMTLIMPKPSREDANR